MAISRGSLTLSKLIRADRGLRRRLAFRCDVSEQTVRNWESGTCPKARYRPVIEVEAGIPWVDFDVVDEAPSSRAA